MDRASLSRFTLRFNETLVIFNHFFADRQTDTRAGILILAMEPLQDVEYGGSILLLKANAVVGEGNMKIMVMGYSPRVGQVSTFDHFAGNGHLQSFLLLPEFDRIGK